MRFSLRRFFDSLRMYHVIKKNIPLLFLLLLHTHCSNDNEDPCAYIPDTADISIKLTVESLEDSIAQLTSKPKLVAFFSHYPTLRDIFFNRPRYPNDSLFINELYTRFNHPSIDTLLQETHEVFGGMSGLKNELTRAFKNLRYYYPNFVPPKIQTVITGLENDLYVSDSLVMIGLDYFIGSTATYRPNTYHYILRRYEKKFVVPSILLLFGIDPQYNKTDIKDRTVLAEMIAYGKAYYFAKQMLPCVPDSTLIGYTAEEIEGSKKYSSLIWKRIIEDEVLYATSHLVKQKYIAERPKTLEVGEKCPGRIATWVGWEIVKAYMKKHPDTPLPELMKKTNAELFLKESAYKPD